MPKLIPISAKKMIKVLGLLGFKLIRTKGSHHFFLNQRSSKTAVIPVHGKEDLGIGLLREILRDIELSVVEYEKIRKKV